MGATTLTSKKVLAHVAGSDLLERVLLKEVLILAVGLLLLLASGRQLLLLLLVLEG